MNEQRFHSIDHSGQVMLLSGYRSDWAQDILGVWIIETGLNACEMDWPWGGGEPMYNMYHMLSKIIINLELRT